MHQGIQTWVGLDIQTLETPYSEILRILNLLRLKAYQHVIDLGAAYGRMGIVMGGLYPNSIFTGIEYVKARVDEGNRVYESLGLKKSHLESCDLASLDFELPEADVYFIYDYGHVDHINRTLAQIQEVGQKRPVRVVVRGKFTKRIIQEQHNGLEMIYEGKGEEFFDIYLVSNTK